MYTVQGHAPPLYLQPHCHGVRHSKSHAREKINSPFFGILRIASDVFFNADSESPHMVKMQP